MKTIILARNTLLLSLLMLGACARDDAPQDPLGAELRVLASSYTAAWNSSDPAKVAAFYAPDGVLTINDGEPARGREAVEAVAQGFMSAFPDLRLSHDRLELDGDRINYHWRLQGTNLGEGGTGNTVDFSGVESWLLSEEGLIQDSLGTYDAQEYARQLYKVPEAIAAMGLSLFPADQSLARAEDGIALEDGSLLVVDQLHGLRKIRPDGSSEPFGKMTVVGYRHEPPESHGGANGMSLEPAGTHVLVADIFGGGIYRVSLKDGQTSRIHLHEYGVNVAVRDSSGAIWFTQSAHNPAEVGEARMWAAIDKPLIEGAVFRIPAEDGRLGFNAELVADGFQFANGLAIDEEAGALYLAESSALRVSRFDVDIAAGTLSNRETIVDGILPDNIELGDDGRLWIGAPLPNTILIWDPETRETRSLFPEPTAERLAMMDEWVRRRDAGESLMPLVTPAAFAPFPGFVTGIILGAADGRTYFSGLMNTLVVMDEVPGG
ncbi:MAG: nuclear transport factor 2 family protein [Pseudomonadota bacterium]